MGRVIIEINTDGQAVTDDLEHEVRYMTAQVLGALAAGRVEGKLYDTNGNAYGEFIHQKDKVRCDSPLVHRQHDECPGLGAWALERHDRTCDLVNELRETVTLRALYFLAHNISKVGARFVLTNSDQGPGQMLTDVYDEAGELVEEEFEDGWFIGDLADGWDYALADDAECYWSEYGTRVSTRYGTGTEFVVGEVLGRLEGRFGAIA